MRFKKGDRVRCIDIKALAFAGDIVGFTIDKIYVVHSNHGQTNNGFDCLEVEDDNAVLRFVNSKRFELENLPVGLGASSFMSHDDGFEEAFGTPVLDPKLQPGIGIVEKLSNPRCDCGGEFIAGTHDDTCSLVISGHWSKFKQE